MKKTIKTSLLACSALGLTMTSGFAQNVDLEHAKSKIDLNGDHFSIYTLDREMNQMMEYVDLILEVARNNGEKIPTNLKSKQIMNHLGLADLKAFAHSSTFKQNRWLNKSYLQTGPQTNGIFSILGDGGKEFALPQFAPAGTDLAVQLQLDLTQMESMVLKLADSFGKIREARAIFTDATPESDDDDPGAFKLIRLLKKTKMTAHLVVDLREGNDTIPMGPLKMKRPDVAIRIDNMNWLWDMFEKDLMEGSKLPFKKSKEGNNFKYTLDDNLRPHMQQFLPSIYIDNDNKYIWLFSDSSFMKTCLSDGDKLKNSAEFKAAFADLPKKGNSMAYISKGLLTEFNDLYNKLALSDEVDKEFRNARPLIDRIIKDITKSDTGYATVISKDSLGIEISGTAPTSAPVSGMLALVSFSLFSSAPELKVSQPLKQ